MGAFTGINMVRQHAGEKSVLVDWASVQTQLEMLLTQGAETPMDVVQHPELPPWFDWTKFRRGQQYFHKNIFAMFVAKMSGLLTILAIPSILRVLMMTKQSFDPLTAFHRYVQTTAIMLTWYNGDLLEPTSRAHKSLMGVRGRHCSASRRAKKAGQGSISQLDMVLTQFGFMGFAVVVPQKLGMAGNLEDVEGFIHFWRVVGYLLGIEDRFNLCRESVLETRLLCEGLVEKVFAPALRKPSDDFRSMSRALVEGMWNMTPFLNYTAFLGFIAHLAGIDDADNNNYYKTKRKTFGDVYSHILLSYQIFVHEVLLRSFIVSWLVRGYLNYQIRLTLYLTERCPFLAYWTFGRENVHVAYSQHS